MKTSEFYVTFGEKYNREPHPLFPDAHPDGWVTVEAPDYETAWAIAFAHLDIYFAFVYREGERPDYPRGELARWTA